MKKIYFLGASLIFLSNAAYSQDQLPLNPTQSLIYVNPSFAGSNGSLRDQYVNNYLFPNFPTNNVIYYNGLDGYVKKLRGGLALSGMINDYAQGTYRESELNLIYAPVFECEESGIKVIPSIQISYIQRAIDYSKMTFGQGFIMLNPNGAPMQKKENFDASAGLLFNYKNLYAGASLFHINQPDVGLAGASKLPNRLSLNASYSIPLNQKTLLNFSTVYTRQQNFSTFQLAANAIFFRHIIAGLGFQANDVVFGNLGYRNNFFSATGGYNVGYSKLSGNQSGSWQLAIAFSLHKKEKGQAPLSFEKW